MNNVWDAVRKKEFLKQHKHLDSKTKQKVNDIVEVMIHSQNPITFGTYKQNMKFPAQSST